MNAFLHNVYVKYKEREFKEMKKIKWGQRFTFICRLIGKCKILAHATRIRLAGKTIRKYVHAYVKRFREKRRLKFEA